MRYTLLDMTQKVLSSIDGDEVNDINDTVESKQVVDIIKRVYGNFAEGADLPEQYSLFHLTASGDADLPVLMTLPEEVMRSCLWVKYDCRLVDEVDANFQPMKFVSLEEFLRRMHMLEPVADSTIGSMTVEANSNHEVTFFFWSDRAPSCYTVLSDNTFIFDAYDSAVENTLQTSKTIAYGETVLAWTESNDFIIPMDDHQLIMNEAIAWAWAEMKQAVNTKAEREVRRQQITHQRKKDATNPSANYSVPTPNYGRK